MEGNKTIWPIFGPLMRLLTSRKFMVAVVTLIVDLVIAYAPGLAEVQTELLTVLTALGSMLIAAIAYEDGRAKSGG